MPNRLIFVVGAPSTGTTVATGTLMVNGYTVPSNIVGFSSQEAWDVCSPLYEQGTYWEQPIRPVTQADKARVQSAFTNMKGRYGNVVLKFPALSLWVPELFNNTGADVILTRRPVDEHAASLRAHWGYHIDKTGESEETWAQRFRDQTDKIVADYGWPVWDFTSPPDWAALEAAVGHPLPNHYYDPGQRIVG